MPRTPVRTSAPTRQRANRRQFGELTQLPSGRWRDRYTGPDLARHKAPKTFPAKLDGEGWLAAEKRLIDLDAWAPPAQRAAEAEAAKVTVAQWLARYLELRASSLRKSTLQMYRKTLENRVTEVGGEAAVLATVPLVKLSAKDVHRWWDAMALQFPDTKPTNRRAHMILRAAMSAAVERELIPVNPVAVKAARSKPKPKQKTLPTTEELLAIVEHLPQPYQFAGALCLFQGLRIGEMLALRRENVIVTGTGDEARAVVRVRANLQRVRNEAGRCVMVEQPPKSAAGRRDVPILEECLPYLEAHLDAMEDKSPRALVTSTRTGVPVLDTSFRSVFIRARKAAGVRDDITPHYGRNWLITALAELGATPAEIGVILGQTDLNTITQDYMKVRESRPEELMRRVSIQRATVAA